MSAELWFIDELARTRYVDALSPSIGRERVDGFFEARAKARVGRMSAPLLNVEAGEGPSVRAERQRERDEELLDKGYLEPSSSCVGPKEGRRKAS